MEARDRRPVVIGIKQETKRNKAKSREKRTQEVTKQKKERNETA
jgi:hypothetical protein